MGEERRLAGGDAQQQHQPGAAERDGGAVDPLGGDQHVGDGEDRDGGDGGHGQLPGRRRQGPEPARLPGTLTGSDPRS
jgi:hypothetical protein